MRPAESHEPLPAEPRTRAKTILVVEDDADTREVMGLLLSTLPASHSSLVPDAAQAIQFAQAVKPDVLIVDYRLPGINGLELYDRLHAIPGLEALPALLLTATRLEALRPEIEQRQLTALEKPFDLDAFLLTIQGMTGQGRSEPRAEEGPTEKCRPLPHPTFDRSSASTESPT